MSEPTPRYTVRFTRSLQDGPDSWAHFTDQMLVRDTTTVREIVNWHKSKRGTAETDEIILQAIEVMDEE